MVLVISLEFLLLVYLVPIVLESWGVPLVFLPANFSVHVIIHGLEDSGKAVLIVFKGLIVCSLREAFLIPVAPGTIQLFFMKAVLPFLHASQKAVLVLILASKPLLSHVLL